MTKPNQSLLNAKSVKAVLKENGYDVSYTDKGKKGYSLKIFGPGSVGDINSSEVQKAHKSAQKHKGVIEQLTGLKVNITKYNARGYREFNLRILVPHV